LAIRDVSCRASNQYRQPFSILRATCVGEKPSENICTTPLPAGGLIYTHNRSTSSSTPGRRILISSFIDVPKHAELVDDASGPLATFSSRIRMCEALGLLQEAEADELHRILKIRNRFSHEVHISFSDQQIKDLCRALTHRVGDNIRVLHSRRKGCLALRERPSFSIS
jgi:hypothetical protein